MKRIKSDCFKLLFLIILIIGTITTSVFAWFSSTGNTISTRINGSIVFEYFHRGRGTKEDPFVITRPIHYYHMVEFFLRTTNLDISENEEAEFGKEYLYFQIGCPLQELADPTIITTPVSETDWYVFDYTNTGESAIALEEDTKVPGTNFKASKTLNMAYYSGERALMPIGSSEVPFLGSIDGHNIEIDNLHIISHSIVNVVDNNGVVQTNVSRSTSDMGVFGCVSEGIDINNDGKIENDNENNLFETSAIRNIYITNAVIDLEGTANQTEVVGSLPLLPSGDSVHSNDFHKVNENGYVDIENGTSYTAYVGYIAGHVYSTQDITNVYVNNSKIVGGSSAISGYGYFGIIIDPETGDAVEALGSEIANIYAAGDDSGFGGSIAMADLYTRIGNVRGIGLSSIKLVTNELMVIDEVAESINKLALEYSTTNAKNPTSSQDSENMKYYYTPEAGAYYVWFRESSPGGFNYLYGESSIINTKSVKTITYIKDSQTGTYKTISGYKIVEGQNNYFGVNSSNIFISTNEEGSTPLVIDDDNHLYYLLRENHNQSYDYPYSDSTGQVDNVYYINPTNQFTSISSSSIPTSLWYIDNDDRLYTLDGNTKYYLDYDKGAWYLTDKTEFYTFSDSSGNYLKITENSLSVASSLQDASKFELSNPYASSTISTIINSTRYYLRGNNGDLELSTNATSNAFSYDSINNAYYISYQGTKYYLASDDGTFRLIPEGYNYKITDGLNYLSILNQSTIQNKTSSVGASFFKLNPNASTTTISTIYSGTETYLGITNGNLSISPSNSTFIWTKEGSTYYHEINGIRYYITYDGGWKVLYTGYKLSMNGNYLNAISATGINSVSNIQDASVWILDLNSQSTSISSLYNGSRVYLGITNGSLVLKNTQTTWIKDGNGYYVTDGGIDFYITYSDGFKLDFEGYKLYDGSNNYLNANSLTTVDNEINAQNASTWSLDTVNATTTISTFYNGSKVYLGINGNNLALSTSYSSFSWTKDANGKYYYLFGGEKAYIVYNNGWRLEYDGYKIKNTADFNYLSISSLTSLTNETEEAASIWLFSNINGSTTISSIYNGTKTYLGLNNNTLALSSAYSSSYWTKEGNSYYITGSNGLKYYLVYDNGWKVTYDTYQIHSGTNYLILSNQTTIASGNSESTNSAWILDPNSVSTTIGILYNNAFRYLGINDDELAVNSSYSNVYWTRDGNSYYTTYNGIRYYLTYEYNSFRVLPKEYVRIKMNYYYAYVYSTMYVRNNANETDTGKFYKDSQNRYYSFYNNTKYYLYFYNNQYLRVTTNKNTANIWQRTANSLYTTINGTNYYLSQISTQTNTNTAWGYSLKKIISDGSGNYLKIEGTNIRSTTNINDATTFTISNQTSGTISTLINGITYYLRSNNNILELSTTSTTWSINNGYISYNNYYLRFNGTNWILTNTRPGRYVLKSGNYYMGYTGTNTMQVVNSSSTNLVYFDVVPGTGNQSIMVSCGTNNYYLYTTRANNSNVTLNASISTNNTNYWRYDGASLSFVRYTTVYLHCTGSNWTVTTTNQGDTIEFVILNPIYKTELLDSSQQDSILLDYTNTFTITETYNGPTKNITIVEHIPNKNLTYFINTPISNMTKTIFDPRNTYTTYQYLDYALSTKKDLLTSYISTLEKYIDVSEIESNLPSGINAYMPIRIARSDETDYDSNSPYKASLKNTGYIVAGGNYYSSGTTVGDIRVSRYNKANLQTYTNNNLLYTVDGSGNRLVTTDDIANYLSYNDVIDNSGNTVKGAKSQFDNMIGLYADGLHFMNAEISMDHIITVPEATILNKKYYDYELPEDCIDFKVLRRGAISFFAGEYFSGNDAFFSLHQIFRDSNQKITAIKEIKLVYKLKTAKLGTADYIYLYSDGKYGKVDQQNTTIFHNNLELTASDLLMYEICFNTNWITNPPNVEQRTSATTTTNNQNRVYYFEIPCNKGEYALGSVGGKTGAYLLYLDIAANGGDEVSSVVSGQGNTTTTSFTVDFRSIGDTSPHAILQFFATCPEETNTENKTFNNRDFEIRVVFDRAETGSGNIYPSGIYNIYVRNKIPDKTIKMDVFLVDDDNDITTPFPYAFRIIYTNSDYTDKIITNVAQLDFYQSIGSFEIPSTGLAIETSYN